MALSPKQGLKLVYKYYLNPYLFDITIRLLTSYSIRLPVYQKHLAQMLYFLLS